MRTGPQEYRWKVSGLIVPLGPVRAVPGLRVGRLLKACALFLDVFHQRLERGLVGAFEERDDDEPVGVAPCRAIWGLIDAHASNNCSIRSRRRTSIPMASPPLESPPMSTPNRASKHQRFPWNVRLPALRRMWSCGGRHELPT